MIGLTRKVRAIVRREYLQRVRTRWFLISTLLVPSLFIGLAILPPLLQSKNAAEKTLRIAVILQGPPARSVAEPGSGSRGAEEAGPGAQGGRLDNRVVERLREQKANVSLAPGLARLSQAELEASMKKDSIDAYLILPPDVVGKGSASVLSTERIRSSDRRTLSRALRQALLSERLVERSVGEADAEQLTQEPKLEFVRTAAVAGASDAVQGMGYAFAVLLYMMLLIYGQMIARGVLEEKSSDVVEIMVSSVRPWEMMLGKILGVSAVGLTQMAIWVAVGAGALAWGAAGIVTAFPEIGSEFAALHIPVILIVAAVLYFLLGYFLYAGLFAAAGAMVGGEGDVQQVLMPVVMLLVVPFLLLPVVTNTPNLPWVVAASLFPLFSPILMVPRMTATVVPVWQWLTSLGLLAAGILVTAWIAGRIYRVGILMKGKRPNLPELVRWLRHG